MWIRESGVRAAMLDALSVLAPVECAGCGAPDRSLCPPCRGALVPARWRRRIDDTDAFAALSYEGSVRRTIWAFKEHGRTDVARALARPLACAIEAAVLSLGAAGERNAPGRLDLLTVPASFAARRRRGYDPVQVLLAKCGLRPARCLVRVRATSAQKSLALAERAENRRGSLASRRDLTGRKFVLVDDVVTTGATAREVIRAVSHAGGQVVAIAALAATPRLDGRSSARWEIDG